MTIKIHCKGCSKIREIKEIKDFTPKTIYELLGQFFCSRECFDTFRMNCKICDKNLENDALQAMSFIINDEIILVMLCNKCKHLINNQTSYEQIEKLRTKSLLGEQL